MRKTWVCAMGATLACLTLLTAGENDTVAAQSDQRTVKVQELSPEAFAPFGWYTDMVNPAENTPKMALGAIEYFPDMLRAHFDPSADVTFSLCRNQKRDLVIDAFECHSHTCECMMPLNADMLLQVAPPSVPGEVPLDKVQVFRVPKGTAVVMRPGTWHHGPFAVDSESVDVLVVLPERTYANDTEAHSLPEEDQIRIEL